MTRRTAGVSRLVRNQASWRYAVPAGLRRPFASLRRPWRCGLVNYSARSRMTVSLCVTVALPSTVV